MTAGRRRRPTLAGTTIAEVGDRFDGDLLGADPEAAWDAAAELSIAAVREKGLARTADAQKESERSPR